MTFLQIFILVSTRISITKTTAIHSNSYILSFKRFHLGDTEIYYHDEGGAPPRYGQGIVCWTANPALFATRDLVTKVDVGPRVGGPPVTHRPKGTLLLKQSVVTHQLIHQLIHTLLHPSSKTRCLPALLMLMQQSIT